MLIKKVIYQLIVVQIFIFIVLNSFHFSTYGSIPSYDKHESMMLLVNFHQSSNNYIMFSKGQNTINVDNNFGGENDLKIYPSGYGDTSDEPQQFEFTLNRDGKLELKATVYKKEFKSVTGADTSFRVAYIKGPTVNFDGTNYPSVKLQLEDSKGHVIDQAIAMGTDGKKYYLMNLELQLRPALYAQNPHVNLP